MNARIQRLSRSSNRCFRLHLSLVALLLLLGTSSRAPAQPAKLITDGFAHNDYEHTRPLLDALALGFCAVEADVFLTNGLMLVGHDPRDLTPTRSLTNLYLDPLQNGFGETKGTCIRVDLSSCC